MGDLDKFLGKWEVTGTENMENMLQAFDMEDDKRQMYANMKFTMEYMKNDGNWSYTVYMPMGMTKTFNFKLGEEFDSSTLDGRPIVSKIDAKDGKFVEFHKDKSDSSLDARMEREVIGDELLVTATVRSISSVTRHKRVA